MPRDANGLTPKQSAFVEEYLIDLNATQAAIRAGYSKKTAEVIGLENLRKPLIAAVLLARKEDRAKKTEITQEYVLEVIRDTIERCRQMKPVLDKQGKPIMVETANGTMAAAYVFDPDAVLKGADLLGKHVGMYEKDNLQRHPYQDLPDDVLQRQIEKKQKEIAERRLH